MKQTPKPLANPDGDAKGPAKKSAAIGAFAASQAREATRYPIEAINPLMECYNG